LDLTLQSERKCYVGEREEVPSSAKTAAVAWLEQRLPKP